MNGEDKAGVAWLWLSQDNHFGALSISDSMFYFLPDTELLTGCAAFDTATGEKLAVAGNNKCSVANPPL